VLAGADHDYTGCEDAVVALLAAWVQTLTAAA
jgi:hypothetical protein